MESSRSTGGLVESLPRSLRLLLLGELRLRLALVLQLALRLHLAPPLRLVLWRRLAPPLRLMLRLQVMFSCKRLSQAQDSLGPTMQVVEICLCNRVCLLVWVVVDLVDYHMAL